MPVRRAFTLIELLVVISIIALLIAILLPALGNARDSARKQQSAINLRSLHQACVVAGGENKGFYPGLDSRGEKIPTGEIPFESTANATNQDGAYIVPRFSIMVAQDIVAGEHLISPADTDRVAWKPDATGLAEGVRHKNISYAVLDIRVQGGREYTRRSWQDNMIAGIPIFSERNSDPGGGGYDVNTKTVGQWDDQGPWQGSLVWNDGHTTFENKPIIKSSLFSHETIEEDHLFDNGNSAVGSYGVGAHVRMIKKNNSSTRADFGAGSDSVAP